MVIECPSCHTKFAVDAQQLADVESPRFHCSRCDHFFEADSAEKKSAEQEELFSNDTLPTLTTIDKGISTEGTSVPGIQVDHEATILTVAPPSLSGASLSGAPPSTTPIIAEPIISVPARGGETVATSPDNRGDVFSYDDAETVIGLDPDKDLTAEQLELIPSEDEQGTKIGVRQFSRMEIDSFLDGDEDGEPLVKANWPDNPTYDTSFEADLGHLRAKESQTSDSFDMLDTVNTTSAELMGGAKRPGNQAPRPRAYTTAGSSGSLASGNAALVPDRFTELLPDEQDAFSLTPSWVTSLQEGIGLGSGVWQTGVSDESSEDEKTFERAERGYPPDRRKKRRRLPKRELEQFEPEEEAFLPQTGGDGPGRFSKRRGLGALALIFSLPLVLTCAFGVWSVNIQETPSVIQELFHFTTNDLPKLPPPGLALIGVRSEVVALDDGSKVLEISGELFNSTVDAYRKVKLEAKVYDKNNHELNRLLVDFNNGLNNARLNSLQADSIEKLQVKQGVGSELIKPNSKSPFRIVLTDIKGEEAYFSARLYSVEASA